MAIAALERPRKACPRGTSARYRLRRLDQGLVSLEPPAGNISLFSSTEALTWAFGRIGVEVNSLPQLDVARRAPTAKSSKIMAADGGQG
jgi:hypothetical protein